MKRKIISCVLVVSLSFSIGCSSSYLISSSSTAEQSFDTFNVDAYGRSGTIVFQDGRKLDVQNIVAFADSIHFLNGTTGARSVVPRYTVKKIVFTNRGIGFLEGFGFGALVGAVSVLILIAASPGQGRQEFGGADFALFLVAVGAGGGGVIGGIPGVIIGHSDEYQFETSADGTKK